MNMPEKIKSHANISLRESPASVFSFISKGILTEEKKFLYKIEAILV